MTEYQCPLCPHKESSRKRLRWHIDSAHPQDRRGLISSSERGSLVSRAKRIKITLPKVGKDKE